MEVSAKIKGQVAEQSGLAREEIEKFQESLKYYFVNLKHQPIYKYETGVVESFQLIQQFGDEISRFEKELENFDYFASMFEFPQKTEEAHKNMKMLKVEMDLV